MIRCTVVSSSITMAESNMSCLPFTSAKFLLHQYKKYDSDKVHGGGGLQRNTTLCDKVCQWLAASRWVSVVYTINKSDRHDITQILLKMALNTINLTNDWNTELSIQKQFVIAVHGRFSCNVSGLILLKHLPYFYLLITGFVTFSPFILAHNVIVFLSFGTFFTYTVTICHYKSVA